MKLATFELATFELATLELATFELATFDLIFCLHIEIVFEVGNLSQ